MKEGEQMGKLSGKTAIITGASTGFGRGTVYALNRNRNRLSGERNLWQGGRKVEIKI